MRHAIVPVNRLSTPVRLTLPHLCILFVSLALVIPVISILWVIHGVIPVGGEGGACTWDALVGSSLRNPLHNCTRIV